MATVWKRSPAIRAARVAAYRNTVVRRCPRSFEMFPAFCGQCVIADPNQNSWHRRQASRFRHASAGALSGGRLTKSLPGARCPLIVWPFQRVMEPRSRRQRSRAAARRAARHSRYRCDHMGGPSTLRGAPAGCSPNRDDGGGHCDSCKSCIRMATERRRA
jgi:hypothetical protein